jgi:hypothetical protein
MLYVRVELFCSAAASPAITLGTEQSLALLLLSFVSAEIYVVSCA